MSLASPNLPGPDEPHLLVVDDDERLRALLQRYLSPMVTGSAPRRALPRRAPDEGHGFRSVNPG
jgi:hypothetical protein